jgi:CheY-like chemotaxis protein
MRVAAERGAKLTDQLLSFSRRQRLEPMSLDINAAVASMQDLLRSSMGGSVQIEARLGADVWPALVDPTQLELAILNLAINARDAMEVGGTLTIKTGNVHLGAALRPEEPSPGDYVEICVADTGTGMTEEIRSKAFEPFFTTKGVGKGSGLGLSQVLGFAKQSGGGLRLETRIDEGTAIHIYLPRAKTKSENISPSRKPMPAGKSPGATILVVDDDDAVRDIAAALLREMGYSVLEASSGGSALDIIERERKIELILVDFAMPGMNGAELARQVRNIRSTLPILFMTGFADRTAMAGVSDAYLVGKPFMDDELANKVRSALAGGEMGNVIRFRG